MQKAVVKIPDKLLHALANAKHVVVFTGAGVSAESGVSTFRDALTGLWARFDPMQLATADAFLADPALVWGWYEWRRQLLLKAQPNAAHQAIAQLAELVPKLTVITQNVDDLHERAGSREVLHLHGSIFKPRCFHCGKPYTLVAAPTMTHEQTLPPPRCPDCQGMILLSPVRLLEMTRYFTLFDKKAGKIVARYQQVFGIKRLIERINTRSITGGREGGVIWHTTGSGKSFTI